MGDKKEDLNRANIAHRHFIFTNESASEIDAVIRAYTDGAALSSEVRRIGKR